MVLNFNSTTLEANPSDDSYRYRAIMGDNELVLMFSLAEHVDFPVGTWCEFEGDTFTLEQPYGLVKNHSRSFDYTLTLEASQAKLKKYKVRNIVDKRIKFNLTARPQEHLQQLVDNLNLRDSGWTIGECIDANEKLISYNHTFCLDALNQIATEFETEWQILQKTISLKKVEHNKENPLALSYGKGNGFRTGVGRQIEQGKKAVEILYVQGGERNIDFSEYGSKELLLPKNKTLIYEGRLYGTDPEGYYVYRADKSFITHEEDSIDLSHIYPSRVGTISSVDEVDPDNNFYDFLDSSIPTDLDFADCVIAGLNLTVIFQSGILSGKEFEVKYQHSTRRFEMVPQEIDGMTMPNATFKPAIGDEYAVFNMMMPDAYISDDISKTGASWDMFREAVKYLYEHEEPGFSFTGELDGIWAKKDWINIGGKIVLGGFVEFTDDQFQIDPILIRIMGIKDYINNPHSPVLELSNNTASATVSSNLKKIDAKEVLTDSQYQESLQFTRRTFRSAQETIKLLQDALLGFTGGINPITVQTMSLLVGDESLQFRWVDDKVTPIEVSHLVSFNTSNLIFTSEAGIIQHMTFGINRIQPTREVSDYHFWDVSEFNSPPLTEPEKSYYLYIRANKTTQAASFYMSETAIEMDPAGSYYYFLMGFLNSEIDGDREFARMYGFTEVLPGQVTTDVVATDTLLAEQARLADWIIRGGKITSAYMDGSTPWATLDGAAAKLRFERGGLIAEIGISGGEPVIKLVKGLNSAEFKASDLDVGLVLSSENPSTGALAHAFINSLYGGFVSARFVANNSSSDINDRGISIRGVGQQAKLPRKNVLLDLDGEGNTIDGLYVSGINANGRAAYFSGKVEHVGETIFNGDVNHNSGEVKLFSFHHTRKRTLSASLNKQSLTIYASEYDYVSIYNVSGSSYLYINNSNVGLGKELTIWSRNDNANGLYIMNAIVGSSYVELTGGAIIKLIYDNNVNNPFTSQPWVILAHRDNNW